MTTHATTHEGLDRIIDGADALRHSVGPARGMRVLPVILLTGMVAAVLAILDRVYDVLSTSGFTSEWVALWLLSAVAVLLLGKTALAASRGLVRSERGLAARWRRAREEAQFAELLRSDPRMAAEFRVARDRSELA